jgi:hypothetical protein
MLDVDPGRPGCTVPAVLPVEAWIDLPILLLDRRRGVSGDRDVDDIEQRDVGNILVVPILE